MASVTSYQPDKSGVYETKILRNEKSYRRASQNNLILNMILQIIILTCTAILPILLTIPQVNKSIQITVSIILALATAYAVFLKPGEHARNLRLASEAIRQEYHLFDLKIEPYDKDLTQEKREESLKRFVTKIDQIEDQLVKKAITSSVYGDISSSAQHEKH